MCALLILAAPTAVSFEDVELGGPPGCVRDKRCQPLRLNTRILVVCSRHAPTQRTLCALLSVRANLLPQPTRPRIGRGRPGRWDSSRSFVATAYAHALTLAHRWSMPPQRPHVFSSLSSCSRTSCAFLASRCDRMRTACAAFFASSSYALSSDKGIESRDWVLDCRSTTVTTGGLARCCRVSSLHDIPGCQGSSKRGNGGSPGGVSESGCRGFTLSDREPPPDVSLHSRKYVSVRG